VRLRARDVALPGALAVALSAFAIGLTQYRLPPAFDNAPAVNRAGMVEFAAALAGSPAAPLNQNTFVWSFRLLLAGMWVGYAAMLIAAVRDDRSRRWAVPLIVGTSIVLALIFPSTLSTDLYAYAGWGRMSAQGWNPYQHTLAEFAAIGDSAARVSPVPATSNHGPIWLVVCAAIARLVPTASPFWQMVAFKLLGATALVVAALSARAIAKTTGSPWSNSTVLAVGLNPVLLLEGPANGHNDIVMMSLMLTGVACHLRGHKSAGYLLLGCSAGVKYLTASVVPWLLLRDTTSLRSSLRAIAAALALMLLPNVASYAVFWRGAHTFDGLREVYVQRTDAPEPSASGHGAAAAGGARAQAARRSPLSTWLRLGALVLVYAGLTVLVVRAGGPSLLPAWAAFALAVVWIGMPIIFAWYMVWPIAAALPCAGGSARRLAIVSLVAGMLLQFAYTVPLPA
jgi:hypothetical protein